MEAPLIKDKFIITDGPGAMQLLASLAEANMSPRKVITISAGPFSEFEVCISFLSQASSTGEQFHFEGWLPRIKRGNIHGHYCTRTRKGWFKRGHTYSVVAGLRQE